MDTHGHHEISLVGKRLIDSALRRAGKRGWRTNAFYLGNWITDVQQGVDPQPYDEVARSLRDGVDSIANSLANLRGAEWQQWLRDQAMPHIRSFQRTGHAVADALTGGRSSRVAGVLQRAFLVQGYFKFVHPERRGGRAQMDYSAYRHVFENSFGQYFPHEHLDRYPKTTSEIASGTVTPDGRGTGSSDLNPHIYSYLRDDLAMCAGQLASLDRDWARRTLSPGGEPWDEDDGNHDWNLKLAQLGHALHAVEDYFAHSNFVEHALVASGAPMPGGHAGDVIRRRLKRMSGTDRDNDDRWETLQEEPHVVTGYFDKWDTLHSLSHVVEELGYAAGHHELPAPPRRHSHGLEAGELIVHLVHELRGRQTNRQTAEAALRRIASGGDDDVDDAVRDAADQVLNHLPSEAREMKGELLDVAISLSQNIPNSTLNVLDVLLFIREFYENLLYPTRLLRWIVAELPEGALRWVVEQVAGAIEDAVRGPLELVVRRIVERQLNRYRVGCHSLLAKDYAWPNEPQINRTYELAKHSAKAVHWYIVKCMIRHCEPPRLPVSRADDDQDNGNHIARRQWIDWLELTETFLRHPAGRRESQADPPAQSRWWHPIFQRRDYRGFPGFNDSTAGRDPALPHQLIYLNRADLDQQITSAERTRSDAAAAYNRGTSQR